MLPVGRRIHRPNVEKRCLNLIGNQECQIIPDIEHKMIECPAKEDIGKTIKSELGQYMGQHIGNKMLLCISFNHKDKRKLKLGVWFAIKMLYLTFYKINDNKTQLLTLIQKELDWNLKMQIKIGSASEMWKLRNQLNGI